MYIWSGIYFLGALAMAVLGVGAGTGKLKLYRADISAPARRRVGLSALFVAAVALAAAVLTALTAFELPWPRTTTLLMFRIGLAFAVLSVATLAFFVIRERP